MTLAIGTQIRVSAIDENDQQTIELGRVIGTIDPPEDVDAMSFDVIVRFADGEIDKCDSRQFLNLVLVAD